MLTWSVIDRGDARATSSTVARSLPHGEAIELAIQLNESPAYGPHPRAPRAIMRVDGVRSEVAETHGPRCDGPRCRLLNHDRKRCVLVRGHRGDCL